MNKHRKVESWRVKVYVRALRTCGIDISYKEARRHIRKRDRSMRDPPKFTSIGFRKAIKRCNYGMKSASSAFARLAEHAAVLARTNMHPLGITAVNESLALYQRAFTEQKLSEDNPKLDGLRVNHIYIDEMAFYNGTRTQWPKENPHIPKEVAHD